MLPVTQSVRHPVNDMAHAQPLEMFRRKLKARITVARENGVSEEDYALLVKADLAIEALVSAVIRLEQTVDRLVDFKPDAQ